MVCSTSGSVFTLTASGGDAATLGGHLPAYFQPALSLLPGTYSDGKACTYTAAGTLLNCNTSFATGTGTASGTNTGDQTITLTGDVTGSGTGSFAATIASNKVTYAKMQQTGAGSVLLGNPTGSAANVSKI